MKAADKRGARYVIVIGEDEIAKRQANIKEMSSGESESIRLVASEIAAKILR